MMNLSSLGAAAASAEKERWRAPDVDRSPDRAARFVKPLANAMFAR